MTVFEMVKISIDIADAARRYGIDVNRYNKAICPFHNDTHPSLSFKGQRFKCFGCDAGGDVIDLLVKLLGISPMEAVRELICAYQLRIDIDKPMLSSEVARIKKQREQKEIFDQWLHRAGNILTEYFRLLKDWRIIYSPKHRDEELHPRLIKSFLKLDYIEHILDDVLISGNAEDKLEFYHKSYRMIEQIRQELIRAGDSKAIENPSGIEFSFKSSNIKHAVKAA